MTLFSYLHIRSPHAPEIRFRHAKSTLHLARHSPSIYIVLKEWQKTFENSKEREHSLGNRFNHFSPNSGI